MSAGADGGTSPVGDSNLVSFYSPYRCHRFVTDGIPLSLPDKIDPVQHIDISAGERDTAKNGKQYLGDTTQCILSPDWHSFKNRF
jgi:hypothetical protein